MKKLIFGISMLALSSISFSAFAASQNPDTKTCKKECTEATCPQKKDCDKRSECTRNSECCKSECPQKKECSKRSECSKRKECTKKSECSKRKACPGVENIGRISKHFRSHRHHGNMNEMLFDGITLSEAQQAKIKDLNAKVKEDRRKNKAEAQAKNRERRDKERAAYNAEIKNILDAQQYAQFESNEKAMQARREAKKSMKASL